MELGSPDGNWHSDGQQQVTADPPALIGSALAADSPRAGSERRHVMSRRAFLGLIPLSYFTLQTALPAAAEAAPTSSARRRRPRWGAG